ncbi:hypothetical protein MCC93_01620 [Morococcus cerebrosus]|uniref:Uncharacterized protein n=2 Tax=Neisseriaceae TaxID=481 RepID=A0A0C1HFX7_9NEIS|nr:hypothetical protein HMPREF1051_2748 [Neisseria sicca VK64]KIC13139.1 hypothetical protein MCC93_01620 [Morococcus cerebrosus]
MGWAIDARIMPDLLYFNKKSSLKGRLKTFQTTFYLTS